MHLLSDLSGFAIEAKDGSVGKVIDFYFNDRRWVIRHIVVEIGSGSGSQKILLSPAAIKYLNHEEKGIVVDLTVDAVSNASCIDTSFSMPRYEIDYLSYYGYAFYWGNTSVTEEHAQSSLDPQSVAAQTHDIFVAIDSVRRMHGDRHLRSFQKSVNYQVQATDGEIGRLKTILIDEDTWAIQYCVASTDNSWPDQQAFLTPQVIRDINWGSGNIYVDLTLQEVKEASLPHTSPLRNPRIEPSGFSDHV